MTHAICALLAVGLAATAAAGPAAAERAPASIAMPALATSVATQALPGLVRMARVFDERWLAAMSAPLSALHADSAPVRAAGGLDAATGMHFATTPSLTNDPSRVSAPPPAAGGRLINASVGTPSGGAMHLGAVPFTATAMRLAGTTPPAPTVADDRLALPEPGTGAMLLAGLLGIGAIVRRRTAL